jgi:hypothetical protein
MHARNSETDRAMFQRHRNVTPRIARMLRELEPADVAQDRPADVAEPAIDPRDHPAKRMAFQWFRVAAALIAAGFLAVVAWQARAVETKMRPELEGGRLGTPMSLLTSSCRRSFLPPVATESEAYLERPNQNACTDGDAPVSLGCSPCK